MPNPADYFWNGGQTGTGHLDRQRVRTELPGGGFSTVNWKSPNKTPRNDVRVGQPNLQQQQAQQAIYDPAATAQHKPMQQPMPQPAPQAATQQQATTAPATPANPGNEPRYSLPQTGQAQVTQDYANHPFFDPGSSYEVPGWNADQLDPNSLAFMQWANQNPEEYYYSILNQMGLGGMDARSQAAQDMLGQFMAGYGAAKTKNMNLHLPQYMQTQNIPWLLDQLSNEQMGIDEGLFRGRDRWGIRGY